MSFEKRELQGGLFENKYKTDTKHPFWRGYIIINQVEYEISGWIKSGQNGEWISLSAKVKEERRDARPQSIRQQALDKVYPPDRITSGRQLPPKQNILPDDEEIPF